MPARNSVESPLGHFGETLYQAPVFFGQADRHPDILPAAHKFGRHVLYIYRMAREKRLGQLACLARAVGKREQHEVRRAG